MPASTPAQPAVSPEWLQGPLPNDFIKMHPYRWGAESDTTDAIVAAAGVKPGMRVVDIGSGTGIPALTIARIVGPDGQVTATDPSPRFVSALMENAAALGLTNFDAVQTSAAQLPFPSESFDAATCHFGVMFFPDMQAGLSQIRRVLKPGARAGFICWGPLDKNRFFGTAFRMVGKYVPSPPPPDRPITDYPNPMRFSVPGSLSAHLRDAAFQDVQEETRMMAIGWNGDAMSMAQNWFESRGVGQVVPRDQWDAVLAEFRDALQPFAKGRGLSFPAAIVVASGAA